MKSVCWKRKVGPERDAGRKEGHMFVRGGDKRTDDSARKALDYDRTRIKEKIGQGREMSRGGGDGKSR